MDFSWVDALPVGFVLFGGTLVALLKRKAGRGVARKGYPRVAEQLGLSYQPGEHDSDSGRLTGEFSGVRVLVLPDQGRIALDLPQELPLCLRNYAHYKRTPPGRESFSSGARWADQWLVNRYCVLGLAERLNGDPELLNILQQLRLYKDQLKQLTVDEQRVECVLEYGSPSYIPPKALLELLPLLLQLAEYAKTVQANGVQAHASQDFDKTGLEDVAFDGEAT